MNYKIKNQRVPKNADGFNSHPWDSISPLKINNYMEEKPQHFPETEVKLLYDEEFIHLNFRVEDRYVRAEEKEDQGRVWEDSCVEFFFTPSKKSDRGYFNIEINCIGTMLFNFQTAREKNKVQIEKEDFKKVRRYSSLKTFIPIDSPEDINWSVAVSVPFEILKKYYPMENPAKGTRWRGNFYKCADKSSHPHWLTWAEIDSPKPDFHRPDCFGHLDFQ